MFHFIDMCFSSAGNEPSIEINMNHCYSSSNTQVSDIIENDSYLDFDCNINIEKDNIKKMLDSPKFILSRTKRSSSLEEETTPSNYINSSMKMENTPKHIYSTAESPVNKVRSLRRNLMLNLF